ncbi:MAG TPA: ABC transporter substrate-binding protein [Nitrososphaerales archaeon]|nr:ABC transporter substrate-binding protein [Nitrososphaerales archaeon]
MRPTRRVVVYGSLGLRPGLSELLWAFRKRNKLEEFPVYLDDHPFQVRERIDSERKHGLKTADVVLMPQYMLLGLAKDGLLAEFRPAGSEKYPEEFKDKLSRWSAIGVTFMSMAYNSARKPRSGLPDSLQEITPERMGGPLGTQSLTASRAGNLGVQYLAFLRRRVGARRWRAFVEGLAAPKTVRSYDCIDHLIQGLVDGDNALALGVYSLAYFREKTSGSPVSLLKIDDAPQMFTTTSVGLLKGSEDNASAKKFLDFLLGAEAQRIISRIPGISAAMKGLSPAYDFEVELPAPSDFHPTELDVRETVAALSLFRKLKLP